MSKEIETVEEKCKHPDCIYRQLVRSINVDACMYAVMQNELRGCKISECDKYKAGQPIKARIKHTTEIWWEYEVYEDGNDTI